MEFTGERMIPEKNYEDIIFSEHLIRYIFAKQFIKDKNVLDIACGSGYGTYELSKAIPKKITGVDISSESIKYAKTKYHNDNLEFLIGDATNLPFKNSTFDIIVSFETIEHLKDYEGFVNEISRCLKDDGLTIISTPNKELYPKGNEFHYKEFTKSEFLLLLKKDFKHVEIINQNSFYINSLFENKEQIKENTNLIDENITDNGMYFIALCSNKKIPSNILMQNLVSNPKELLTYDILDERDNHISILKKDIEHHKNIISDKVDIINEREKHINILKIENKELINNIDFLQTNTNSRDEGLTLESKLINSSKTIEIEQKRIEKHEESIKRDDRGFNELIILLQNKETQNSKILEDNKTLARKLEKAISQEQYNESIKSKDSIIIERDKHIDILIKEENRLKKSIEFLKSKSVDPNLINELELKLQSSNKILNSIEEKNTFLQNYNTEKSSQIDKLIEILSKKELQLENVNSININLQQELNNSISKKDHQETLDQFIEYLEITNKETLSEGYKEKTHDLIENIHVRNLLTNEFNSRFYNIAEKHKTTSKELLEERKKSEYLYSLKNSLEATIINLGKNETELNDEIRKIKKSISWKILSPLRILRTKSVSLSNSFSAFSKDILYGIKLLKREGIKSFIYRALWYSRGKRLNEDIFVAKRQTTQHNRIKENTDFKTQITFDVVKEPTVSIIIPVYNKWEYTYNCLKSIKENTRDVSYEIIIGDDCSTDETLNIKKIINNIKVIKNNKTLYFIQNCNNSAKHAKSKYVLFLNNDVVVHPNWLEPLVRIAEEDKKVGIVGSKLIYPDGRLQEAGGIIWDDASGWNFGRLDDPEKPDYNYVKEVDYVSGASLLINRKLWNDLEGFDTHYLPAYYEDTDLAFKVRKRGYKVIYQPASCVTHYEGISNGKSENEGIKKYQVDNKEKFLSRWKNVLMSEHFKNGENAFLARERSAKKSTILVIDHYVPHFDQDAGSRSTFSYLKLFVKMGFNVKFIGDNFYKHEPYTTVLQQMGIEVLYGNYYKKNIMQWIKQNGMHLDFVITHRMHIAPNYLEHIKKFTKAKIAYVGHDLQFLSSERKYELTKEKSHLDDSIKFKAIEKEIFNMVDIIFPFSTLEEKYIKEIAPNKIVQAIPVYFYDNIPSIKSGFKNRKDLLFVGGFAHPPNEDGLLWFVNNVFDNIKKTFPEIKLYVVGSKPTDRVKRLASDSIIITGYVSDKELERYYLTCKVAVIPLQYGAGVKGKLLESLYYQLPAVITSVAAEGVPEIENHTIIADSIKTYTEKIELLYATEKVWNSYSGKGKSLIIKYFTEEATRKTIANILYAKTMIIKKQKNENNMEIKLNISTSVQNESKKQLQLN